MTEQERHPQDRALMQRAAWMQVWEAARAHDNFQDFRADMDALTFRLRWELTRGQQAAEQAQCTRCNRMITRTKLATVQTNRLACAPDSDQYDACMRIWTGQQQP
jgi:hypothetical protein